MKHTFIGLAFIAMVVSLIINIENAPIFIAMVAYSLATDNGFN